GLDPQERWLCPMPLAHVGGLSILIRSAVYGTTAVLHERFDTEAVAAALADPGERITVVSLVPTMLGRLLDAGLRAPPTLRWALVGGGPNVSPAEVEAVLLEHPAVADVAVHPRQDPEWGEAVIATVVLREGVMAGAEELRAHCAARLSGFKVPKEVGFADRLPRTAS